MSEPASPPPPSPRRTINDLPTELKERIVELCAEQDRAFKERLEQMKKDDKLAEDAILASKLATRGCSVKALFQVSKEFSRLAAPYLFQILKISKVDIHFKCAIAPFRLAYFTELHLDNQDLAKLQDLLGALPRLAHIKTLVIAHKVLERLWNLGPITFDMAVLNGPLPQYAAAAFGHLRRVEQIRTTDVKMSAFAPFVKKVAPGLRSLHLHFAVHGNSRLDGLAVVLSSCTTLEDLEIRYDNERHSNYPFNLDFVVQTITRSPRLQHLSLSAGQYHTSMIPFAALFSSTLVNLKLSATSTFMSGIISPAPQFSSETFPRVENLSLSGLDSLTRTTRRSIEPRHFPALTTLELDLTLAPWTSRTDSPLSTFSTFHHLRNLSIPNLLSMGEASSDEVVRFAEDNALSLQPSPRASSTDNEEEDSFDAFLPPSRRIGAMLRRTLLYLEEQVQKAEEQDDDAALQRYRDVLKTVEVERVVDELWKGA